MKPISTTDMAVLQFNVKEGVTKIKINAQSNKIGWLHAKSDQPGARYDIEVKDGLGRSILRKENCGNDTDQFGELVNQAINLGEELEISIGNVKGAEKIDLSIN